MKFEKLVRDYIPQIIKDEGRIPITRQAEGEEFRRKLREKLSEEVNEYINDPSSEELADILEVIHKLCESHDIRISELEDIRRKKAEERGAFEARLILERISEKDTE